MAHMRMFDQSDEGIRSGMRAVSFLLRMVLFVGRHIDRLQREKRAVVVAQKTLYEPTGDNT